MACELPTSAPPPPWVAHVKSDRPSRRCSNKNVGGMCLPRSALRSAFRRRQRPSDAHPRPSRYGRTTAPAHAAAPRFSIASCASCIHLISTVPSPFSTSGRLFGWASSGSYRARRQKLPWRRRSTRTSRSGRTARAAPSSAGRTPRRASLPPDAPRPAAPHPHPKSMTLAYHVCLSVGLSFFPTVFEFRGLETHETFCRTTWIAPPLVYSCHLSDFHTARTQKLRQKKRW